MRQVPGLRWWIAILILLATLINFLNRLTVSVLAPVITAQFHLSAAGFASITNSFLIAYTLSQALSGRLYDAIGNRRGFSFSIVVWSLASMAHVFAAGLASLNCCRFLLGLGEAGNWPGAAKVIAEWFPPRQRAFGMALFNSGVSIGSVLAPPLIIGIEQTFGWRATFLALGALGFLWLGLWLAWYQPPERHPRITPGELALLRADRAGDAAAPRPTVRALLRRRQTWAIVLARFCCDPVWWFYITWLPLYLFQVHGFNLKQIGQFAWVPYLAADAGSLFGGWASGALIARGWSVDRARRSVILLGMVCMCAGMLAPRAAGAAAALALISAVLFGFQTWINNVQTMPADWFPTSAVASVAGLGGMGAGIGAMLFTQTTGFVVDRFSYSPVLFAAGALPLAGTALLLLLGGSPRERA
ncbi:MAG: MFS transporter [Acidobacteriota bacterium]|nr:MFS transporter [Acidobacteriota bacterium]